MPRDNGEGPSRPQREAYRPGMPGTFAAGEASTATFAGTRAPTPVAHRRVQRTFVDLRMPPTTAEQIDGLWVQQTPRDLEHLGGTGMNQLPADRDGLALLSLESFPPPISEQLPAGLPLLPPFRWDPQAGSQGHRAPGPLTPRAVPFIPTGSPPTELSKQLAQGVRGLNPRAQCFVSLENSPEQSLHAAQGLNPRAQEFISNGSSSTEPIGTPNIPRPNPRVDYFMPNGSSQHRHPTAQSNLHAEGFVSNGGSEWIQPFARSSQTSVYTGTMFTGASGGYNNMTSRHNQMVTRQSIVQQQARPGISEGLRRLEEGLLFQAGVPLQDNLRRLDEMRAVDGNQQTRGDIHGWLTGISEPASDMSNPSPEIQTESSGSGAIDKPSKTDAQRSSASSATPKVGDLSPSEAARFLAHYAELSHMSSHNLWNGDSRDH